MRRPTEGPGVTALVFTGGDLVPSGVAARLPEATLVVAADSGLAGAEALGCHVDLVVGDLDSVDPDALAAAEAGGAIVERHPAEKDATDLELALMAALAHGARHVVVVGGHGGRVDHFMANALLLASARFERLGIVAWLGAALVTVIRDRAGLRGAPGSLCTLLAVEGAADGVTTTGLRYALTDACLAPGSTQGVSNVFVEPEATVTVTRGTLLAIQPDALEVS